MDQWWFWMQSRCYRWLERVWRSVVRAEGWLGPRWTAWFETGKCSGQGSLRLPLLFSHLQTSLLSPAWLPRQAYSSMNGACNAISLHSHIFRAKRELKNIISSPLILQYREKWLKATQRIYAQGELRPILLHSLYSLFLPWPPEEVGHWGKEPFQGPMGRQGHTSCQVH